VPLVADPVAAHRVWHRPPIIDRPSPSPPPGDQRFFTAAARTQINELPWLGHVRIGNFYEPFGLEATTSDLYLTFMERANTDMISPDRHIGVMAFDHINCNQDTLWELGTFCSAGGDGGMIFQDARNDTASTVAGRLTWLPWYDECTNGRGLLHLGMAANYQRAWANEYPLAKGPDTRPEESHLGLPYNFTMTNVDHVSQLGGEAAWVYGPFSLQSEYAGAYVTRLNGTSSPINAAYIQASYFLTGENRVYDRNMGCWTRVRPFENFFRVRTEDGCVCTGKGAWEVAYRWDNIDFTDALSTANIATANGFNSSAMASRFSNHTLGLNWYLNPFTRLEFNYVYSTEIDTQAGPLASGGVHTSPNYLNVFEMRAQIDF
ncbi:MAG: porin, partial [Thermoguttaceae bacterium]